MKICQFDVINPNGKLLLRWQNKLRGGCIDAMPRANVEMMQYFIETTLFHIYPGGFCLLLQ